MSFLSACAVVIVLFNVGIRIVCGETNDTDSQVLWGKDASFESPWFLKCCNDIGASVFNITTCPETVVQEEEGFCEGFHGSFFPAFEDEEDWNDGLRAVLYVLNISDTSNNTVPQIYIRTYIQFCWSCHLGKENSSILSDISN